MVLQAVLGEGRGTEMSKNQKRMIEQLNKLVEVLGIAFNDGKKGAERETGVVIVTFPINGAEGDSIYFSNGINRRYAAKMMKNLIGKLETSKRETLQ
jgi:hypothetical protein